MTSSAEVYILMKLADLGKRCGLKVDDAEGFIESVDEENDPKGVGYYHLSFTSPSVEDSEQADKFFDLLGVDKQTKSVKRQELGDLADMVDRALSLAPRARQL